MRFSYLPLQQALLWVGLFSLYFSSLPRNLQFSLCGLLAALLISNSALAFNDNFSDAVPVYSAGVYLSGSNVGATLETGEPNHASVSNNASVWWRWHATESGQVYISTVGSNFDTVLGVYTGAAVNDLTEIESSDSGSGIQAQLIFSAQADTTYAIAVAGFGGSTGDVRLSIHSIGVSDLSTHWIMDDIYISNQIEDANSLILAQSESMELIDVCDPSECALRDTTSPGVGAPQFGNFIDLLENDSEADSELSLLDDVTEYANSSLYFLEEGNPGGIPENGSWTIAGWAKADGDGPIFQMGDGEGGGANQFIGVSVSSTDQLVSGIRGATNTTWATSSANTITKGQWFFYALVRDYGNTLSLYHNADLVAGGPGNIDNTGPINPAVNNDIIIGAARTADTGSGTNFGGSLGRLTNWFDGAIGETYIWSKPLSQTEIDRFYENFFDSDSDGIPDIDEPLLISGRHYFPSNCSGTTHAADLDGDGDADIISASFSQDTVCWLRNGDALGNNTGTFSELNIISTSVDGPRSVFSADMDQDSDMDILIASQNDDTIGWFQNDGAGNFSTVNVLNNQADGGWSVYSIDLDGDGDNDVVSASSFDDTIEWYRNEGSGSFTLMPAISTTANAVRSIYVVDLDTDNLPDILSASFNDDKIRWYENLGGSPTIAFGPEQVISSDSDGANAVYAAYINDDIYLDILSASSVDGTVAWYENLGGSPATFGTKQIISSSGAGEGVYAEDYDGDGDFDVFSNGTVWFENDGAGNFVEKSLGHSTSGSIFFVELDDDSDKDILDGVGWLRLGTDPLMADTDGDGLSDGKELILNTYPGFTDSDDDGLSDSAEVTTHLTNPLASDSDTDGLSDGDEINSFSTDPLLPDTDGDRLLDGEEVNLGLSPTLASSDIDSLTDGDELLRFSSPEISNNKSGATAIFAADMNGDGLEDILSAAEQIDTVSWFKNEGNSFIEMSPITTTTTGVSAVIAEDFNKDGYQDVAYASDDAPSGTIVWASNDGAGNFTHTTISNSGIGAFALHATDIDGDGDMDIFGASSSDNTIRWFRNGDAFGNNTGTFGSEQIITSSADGARSVYAADFDEDGDMDIAIASEIADRISWYRNGDDQGGGTGAFEPEQIITPANDVDGAWSVFASDLDNDGHTDILSASYGDNTIKWYKNDGAGNFSIMPAISTSANGARSVFASDLDGDGLVDVISASESDDKVTWYRNTGAGSFKAMPPISLLADGARAIYAKDMDGDGDNDVISASWQGEISWYQNIWGAFSPTELIDAVAQPVFSVDAVDFNLDGSVDVLSAEYFSSTINWYQNDGTGSFNKMPPISTTASNVLSVHAVDIDGDLDKDVVAAVSNDGLGNQKVVWYRNGDSNGSTHGVFSSAMPVGLSGGSARSIYAANLDSDVDYDILSTSLSGDKVFWHKNGDSEGNNTGIFNTESIITSEPDGPISVVAKDLDNDGDIDVITASTYDDTVRWYSNNGLGVFTAMPPITTAANSAWSVHAEDISGNGYADILVSNQTGKIDLFENTGSGNFTKTQSLNSGALAAHLEDLDGDTDIDLIGGANTKDRVAWYRNNGTGLFSAWLSFSTTGTSVYSADSADFDGDGDLDTVFGTSYGVEWFKLRSDPNLSDTDSDGLPDDVELQTYQSDPNNSDSDFDGLNDFDEVNTYGTSPTLADTDGDGVDDGEEVLLGYDPTKKDIYNIPMPLFTAFIALALFTAIRIKVIKKEIKINPV